MWLLNILEQFAWDQQACNAAGVSCGGGIGQVVVMAKNAIGSLQGVILAVIVSLAVLMVAYGGILMLTSGGDPGKVKKGKECILWGVIGVVVVLYAYQIISWVVLIVQGNTPAVGNQVANAVGIILQAVFGLIGLIAVVVVLMGGINMMTSSGDPGKVRKSKDTLMWGLVGLIICIFASAIVTFVLNMIAGD